VKGACAPLNMLNSRAHTVKPSVVTSVVQDVAALLQHWSFCTVVTTTTLGTSAAVKGWSKKTTLQVGKGG
jgi:hypothetical protein